MAWSKIPGVPLIGIAIYLLVALGCDSAISKLLLALFGRMAYTLPFFLGMGGIAQYVRVHYIKRARWILRGLATVPLLCGIASGGGILLHHGALWGGKFGAFYYDYIGKLVGGFSSVIVGMPPLLLLLSLLWEDLFWQSLGRKKTKENNLFRVVCRPILQVARWTLRTLRGPWNKRQTADSPGDGRVAGIHTGTHVSGSIPGQSSPTRGRRKQGGAGADPAWKPNIAGRWANGPSAAESPQTTATGDGHDERASLPFPDSDEEDPIPIILPDPEADSGEVPVQSEQLGELQKLIQDVVRRLARVELVPSEAPARVGMSNIVFEFQKKRGQSASVRNIERIAADIGVETGRAPVRTEVAGTIRFELPLKETERRFAPIKGLLLDAPVLAHDPIKYLIGRRHDASPFELPARDALHMLVGGQTGGGKTVLLHTIIFGLIFRYAPSRVRLALYDHKIEEFSRYRGLPHLWQDIVTTKDGFHQLLANLRIELQKRKQMRTRDPEVGFPALVTIMDEFRGLSDKKLTELIAEARALDMFFILATQHPIAEVVSTAIKANLVTRIALKVRDQTASHLIIQRPDAMWLLPKGDCLVHAPSGFTRAQAGWCTKSDLKALSVHLLQVKNANSNPT